MKKSALVILVALSNAAFAQGSGLKPGLWEIKQVSQMMDGHDMLAQVASAQAQMKQALANMPAAQRKQMEAMMGSQGAQAGGGTRICISPAMAARNKPMIDSEGRCEPAKISSSGNKTSFEFNCTANGRTTVGKGESIVNSGMITTRMDMTMTDARGRHTMQSESQMKHLGPDCQGIKPVDQLAKEIQGAAR